MTAIGVGRTRVPLRPFYIGMLVLLYLPIAVSAPIFVGGMVRWGVDKELFKRFRKRDMTEEEMIAETDKSPGVLLASGYIAGGALAGILVAFSAEFLSSTVAGFEKWSEANNPLFSSDLLALLPFAILAVVLYMVGREALLSGNKMNGPADGPTDLE